MEPIKQIKSVAQTYSEMIEGYKSKPDSKKPSKEKKLDEMRVIKPIVDAIRNLPTAVSNNVKQRGVLGALGVNPEKGFLKQLGKKTGVEPVKDELGYTIAATHPSGVNTPAVRAANRVITGGADKDPVVIGGYLGRMNVTKPPENPVIKHPIITQGLPNMDDAGDRRLQRKTGIDLGASPGPEGVPLGNPKATEAVEANRRRQFLKNTKSSVNQELPVSHPVSHPEITSPPKHESNSESRQHPKPRRSNR